MMFYDLIYTRCSPGIDIKKGYSLPKSGHMVYGCSEELLTAKDIDLDYLLSVISKRPTVKDPGFMDEAYLYHTPAFGYPWFVNFHPIHFDLEKAGVARPGNYVNHVLGGDFSSFYPFELFGDDSVWYAKYREEESYYKDKAEYLPMRNIQPSADKTIFGEIRAFIQNGRKELFKQAIAFVLAQYSKPNKERKYLIIKDISTRNIELWIAAIEMAFSPRIASGISFATRMEKALNNNRYFTNEKGEIPQTANVPAGGILRYHAMIVGMVPSEGDYRTVNALPNAPYVVLDGENMKISASFDVSDPYYELISSFSEQHGEFCREFLQMFGFSFPTTEIFKVYELYKKLQSDRITAEHFADLLESLNKYEIMPSYALREICASAKEKVNQNLSVDFISSIRIIDWVGKYSGFVQGSDPQQDFSHIVAESFIDLLFYENNKQQIADLWETVKGSSFGRDVAQAITAAAKNEGNVKAFAKKTSADAAAAACVILEAQRIIQYIDISLTKDIAGVCAYICGKYQDRSAMKTIVDQTWLLLQKDSKDFWIGILNKFNAATSSLLVYALLEEEPSLTASEAEMTAFCEKLVNAGQSDHLMIVIDKYISLFRSSKDIIAFSQKCHGFSFSKYISQDRLCVSFDQLVNVSMSQALEISKYIQKNKAKETRCINSAHIAALDCIMNNGKIRIDLLLDDYIAQGFPSIENKQYAAALTATILKSRLSDFEYGFLANKIVGAPEMYYYSLLNAVIPIAARNVQLWNETIISAERERNSVLRERAFRTLVKALIDSRESKKNLEKMGAMIGDRAANVFYSRALQEATEHSESQNIGKKKSWSFFGKK